MPMRKVISGISADLKRIQESIWEQLKETDTKKMFLMNMPYILTGYFANLVSRMYRLAAGNDFSEKVMFFMQDLENILANPFPSLHLTDLGIGVAWGIALKFVVLQKAKMPRNSDQAWSTALLVGEQQRILRLIWIRNLKRTFR